MFKNFTAIVTGVIFFIFLNFIVGAFLHLAFFGWDSAIFPQTLAGRIIWFLASLFSGVMTSVISRKHGFLLGLITGLIIVVGPFAGVVFMNWGEPTFHTLLNDLGSPFLIIFLCVLNILFTGLGGLIVQKKLIFKNEN